MSIPVDDADRYDVVIIGGGISGIGAAAYITREFPKKKVALLEARDSVGGTWDLFRYPGIRSDSDLHTFAYEFKSWRHETAIAPTRSCWASGWRTRRAPRQRFPSTRPRTRRAARWRDRRDCSSPPTSLSGSERRISAANDSNVCTLENSQLILVLSDSGWVGPVSPRSRPPRREVREGPRAPRPARRPPPSKSRARRVAARRCGGTSARRTPTGPRGGR
ncbi:putative monooxygenase [Rhodococcus opacus B4]|uniref:Putative monooxygenase n=1 Tax=Rhodococcus opacus (strain B4) TaxID=632772 RepID=C1AS97_RHOOB|nr:putative monooxygenase [Rhodococcus opacus B4]